MGFTACCRDTSVIRVQRTVNRLWLALLVYLLIWLGADVALAAAGVDKSLIGLINIAANVVVGFEASTIQRWTLERRSWSEVGTVVGRNRAECERRFFDKWLQDQPMWRRQLPADHPMHAFDVSPEVQQTQGSELKHRQSLWRRMFRRQRASA